MKQCKHEWRFQERVTYKKEIFCFFYCIHCLVQNVKWGDMNMDEIVKQHVAIMKEWSKKRLKRMRK